uniref:Uncharacterized protein n=1 Tax=Kalanchoe fedtschenkoi TaxID=63787 RepID=A0A7N0V6W6_KALFE
MVEGIKNGMSNPRILSIVGRPEDASKFDWSRYVLDSMCNAKITLNARRLQYQSINCDKSKFLLRNSLVQLIFSLSSILISLIQLIFHRYTQSTSPTIHLPNHNPLSTTSPSSSLHLHLHQLYFPPPHNHNPLSISPNCNILTTPPLLSPTIDLGRFLPTTTLHRCPLFPPDLGTQRRRRLDAMELGSRRLGNVLL